MITMFDEAGARSRSHGLRPEVVAAQAERLGLRQVTSRCTWPTYDAAFAAALDEVAADGVTHVVFGDILFPEHRQWAENICAPRGLTAVEPLFAHPRAICSSTVASGAEAVRDVARRVADRLAPANAADRHARRVGTTHHRSVRRERRVSHRRQQQPAVSRSAPRVRRAGLAIRLLGADVKVSEWCSEPGCKRGAGGQVAKLHD
jgi:hypothetical protein